MRHSQKLLLLYTVHADVLSEAQEKKYFRIRSDYRKQNVNKIWSISTLNKINIATDQHILNWQQTSGQRWQLKACICVSSGSSSACVCV